VLVVPIVLFQNAQASASGGRQMNARWSWFNITSVFARLRLPVSADRSCW
jgi:hypothetical protein